MKNYIPILGLFIAKYPVKRFTLFFAYHVFILGLSTALLTHYLLSYFLL